MSFVALPGPLAGFVRRGSNPAAAWPDNGSAYLQAQPLMFSFTNGSVFDLISVDLAEFSITATNTTVSFVGFQEDGGTVTSSFTTDGVIDGTGPLVDFQTFFFGSEFNNLSRVEISSAIWSLDNLVVAVPEPSVMPLLLIGGSLFAGLRVRCRTRSLKRGWP